MGCVKTSIGTAHLLSYDRTKARNKGHSSLDSYMDLSKYDYLQKAHHFA